MTNENDETWPKAKKDSESAVERLVMCRGTWQEATTRKNTLKLCSDMFITDYKGHRQFVIVKNSRIVSRRNLLVEEKMAMVEHYGLEPIQTGPFINAKTYRTPQSNNLVEWMLREVRKNT